MLQRWKSAALFIAFGGLAHAQTSPLHDATPYDASRGELLYTTHCIACHSDEVHWRDKKIVTDWNSLQTEIRRWTVVSGLRWSYEDVAEVGRYLNAAYYRFPAPEH